MNIWRWIFVGVVIAGVLSGPGALDAGAAAKPPIQWPDILFAFFGSVLGVLFVIGFQLFRRDPKPSRWALYFFAPASLWFAVSGLSAAIFAFARGNSAPYVFLFLAVGAGSLLGVWVCWLIFRRRFKNVL